VAAGGGDFKRPPGLGVAPDVAEVRALPLRGRGQLVIDPCQRGCAEQMQAHLAQVVGCEGSNLGVDRGFVGAGCRDHQPTAGCAGGDRHGETAANGAQFASQREFAGKLERFERLDRQLTACREHADGDREIKPAGVFGKIGRGEIDGEAAIGKVEAAMNERGTHPLAAFTDRSLRQTHDVECGQAAPDMNLVAGKPEGLMAERPDVAPGCRPDRRLARPTGQAIGMREPSCARRGRRPWDSPSTSGRVGVPAR